jgi:hypothetical protein
MANRAIEDGTVRTHVLELVRLLGLPGVREHLLETARVRDAQTATQLSPIAETITTMMPILVSS